MTPPRRAVLLLFAALAPGALISLSAPPTQAARKATGKQVLTLGRSPANAQAPNRWEPLAEFVAQRAGVAIQVKAAANYDAFEGALRKGQYAIANAGPLLCSTVRDLYEPLVGIERQGVTRYLGILFSLKSSADMRQLTDLRGKRLGLVGWNSSSGGLYPLLTLLGAGLQPGKDVAIHWLGSHGRVAEAVRDGIVDAGACFEDCRSQVWPDPQDKARYTRLLSYTDEIPPEMIIVRRKLRRKVKRALRAALLAAGKRPELLAKMSEDEVDVSGIVPVSPQALKPVVQARRELARNRITAKVGERHDG